MTERDHMVVALERHVDWMHHYIVALESKLTPEAIDNCVLEANDAAGGSDVDPLTAVDLSNRGRREISNPWAQLVSEGMTVARSKHDGRFVMAQRTGDTWFYLGPTGSSGSMDNDSFHRLYDLTDQPVTT